MIRDLMESFSELRVMEKQEREERKQNFSDYVKFWEPILVGSICGGVIGYLLIHFVKSYSGAIINLIGR